MTERYWSYHFCFDDTFSDKNWCHDYEISLLFLLFDKFRLKVMMVSFLIVRYFYKGLFEAFLLSKNSALQYLEELYAFKEKTTVSPYKFIYPNIN